MSFGRRLRGSPDVYWPAFVDVFVVLLAVAMLATPAPPPPPPIGPTCNAPSHCEVTIRPPSTKPEMTFEQFQDKRLTCRTITAAETIKRVVAAGTPVAVGASIRFVVPVTPVQSEDALPKVTKRIADSIVEAIFRSDLRLRLQQDPMSIRLSGVSVRKTSTRKDEAVSTSYAEQLQDYLAQALAGTKDSVQVTHEFTEHKSQQSPQVWINLSTALIDEARTRARTDWEQGLKPCPISPTS
jgi:hypothetical protein